LDVDVEEVVIGAFEEDDIVWVSSSFSFRSSSNWS